MLPCSCRCHFTPTSSSPDSLPQRHNGVYLDYILKDVYNTVPLWLRAEKEIGTWSYGRLYLNPQQRKALGKEKKKNQRTTRSMTDILYLLGGYGMSLNGCRNQNKERLPRSTDVSRNS